MILQLNYDELNFYFLCSVIVMIVDRKRGVRNWNRIALTRAVFPKIAGGRKTPGYRFSAVLFRAIIVRVIR